MGTSTEGAEALKRRNIRRFNKDDPFGGTIPAGSAEGDKIYIIIEFSGGNQTIDFGVYPTGVRSATHFSARSYAALTLPPLFGLTIMYLFWAGWRNKHDSEQ